MSKRSNLQSSGWNNADMSGGTEKLTIVGTEMKRIHALTYLVEEGLMVFKTIQQISILNSDRKLLSDQNCS